jgi:hypothetical protein
LTEKKKLTEKLSPVGSNRQESFPDGFPSGKLDFPYQFVPDGLSLTVTVTDDLP